MVYLSNLIASETIPITKTIPLIIIAVYFVVLIVNVIGLIVYNYKTQLKNDSLQKNVLKTQLELKEQELKYLKYQLHPHFLFNSLNTIYGFTLQKSDKASEMVLKLSNLLDYTLYQANKNKISLKEEINHLKDYITLEKLRFEDVLDINFKEEIQNYNIEIAPMLLMPFVENAFKHGNIVQDKLKIDIAVFSTDEILTLTVINSLSNNLPFNHGLGLTNIKKRLELIYPNNHQLNIEQKKNQFKVLLKLNLKQQ